MDDQGNELGREMLERLLEVLADAPNAVVHPGELDDGMCLASGVTNYRIVHDEIKESLIVEATVFVSVNRRES
jgi:hypothetical protein